jgi:hypothetical protein
MADRSVQNPAPRRKWGGARGVVIVVIVGLVLLALVIAALPIVLDLTACSAAEKRVFAEFPHYGGVRLQPAGEGDAGSCMATYRAPASEERVLAYYQQALRSRGWTLQPPQTNTGGDVQGHEFRSGELSARRGDYTYAVLYEGGPALQGGGTHVAVHVSSGAGHGNGASGREPGLVGVGAWLAVAVPAHIEVQTQEEPEGHRQQPLAVGRAPEEGAEQQQRE